MFTRNTQDLFDYCLYFLFNVGLEQWKYRSIEHGAAASDKKARMPVATFTVPDDNVNIGLLTKSWTKTRLKKSGRYVDYLRCTMARKKDGKPNLEFLKL